MKRSNEKGDQRREEAEADEESEEAGTWQAASKEELATRKIIKVNRKSTGSSGNISNPVPAAPTTSNNFSNPFVGFSIPAAALSSVTKALEPASVNNPFAGFSFAKNDAPTLPTNPSISNSQASNSRGSSLPSAKSAISSSNETELMKKVRKLNESFLSWAERQMKEKAVAVWKDGVKDYIKYQSNLKEKYGNEATTQKEESRTTGTSSGSVGVIASEKEIKSDPPKPFSFSLPESAQKPATATILPPSAPLPVAPAPAAVSSTSLPSSAFSFSFKPLESSKKASEPAPVPVPAFATTPTTSNGFSFSFPSFPSTTTPSTTAASSNFSFPTSFGNNAEKKDTTSSSAFSFATTLPQTQVAADDGEGGGGDDDEGEPILPPEKILKNENDTDDILLEVPCKLFGFNLQEKEWKDSGKGSFRVTKDVNSGKRRMIVRNTMGKITFNAAFYKDMKIDQVKGGIKFFAVVADATDDKKTELKNFMIKLKDFDISRVKSFLESIIKEL